MHRFQSISSIQTFNFFDWIDAACRKTIWFSISMFPSVTQIFPLLWLDWIFWSHNTRTNSNKGVPPHSPRSFFFFDYATGLTTFSALIFSQYGARFSLKLAICLVGSKGVAFCLLVLAFIHRGKYSFCISAAFALQNNTFDNNRMKGLQNACYWWPAITLTAAINTFIIFLKH